MDFWFVLGYVFCVVCIVLAVRNFRIYILKGEKFYGGCIGIMLFFNTLSEILPKECWANYIYLKYIFLSILFISIYFLRKRYRSQN